MNKVEAREYADKMNKHDDMYAQVVRILPEHVDPIKGGDDGWDVKITHLPNFNNYED
ncbi:hypothetical protein OAA60_00900 [Porticoccaceae bacterium]|nr:hypothetical protein [Porticoccaceae bacterium]